MKNRPWQQLKVTLVAVLAMLFATPVYSLGLGTAEVQSYLNQPLLVRIPLITRSDEELGTITAGFASASDIEMMGLSRVVSVPLHFEVYSEQGSAYVQVSSRLAISDPIVQLVLEVKWSGGRMLREYTMFLDPPTFASKAPLPVITPAPPPGTVEQAQRAPQESYPDPATLDVVETIKSPAVEQAEVEKPEVEKPAVERAGIEQAASDPVTPARPAEAPVETPSQDIVQAGVPEQAQSEEPAVRETRQTPTVPDQPVTEPEPAQLVQEVASETPDQSSLAPEPAADIADDETVEVPAPVDSEPELSVAEIPEAVAGINEPTPEAASIEDSAGTESPLEDMAPTPEQEPAATAPAPAESPVVQAEDIDSPLQSSDEVHGPVQKGETLWTIASSYSRGSSYSINQAMLAIQRLNPDAFGGGNINSLKQGVILRLPTFEEVGRLNKRQAMLEAMNQEQAYLAMRESGRSYEEVPAIADTSVNTSIDEPAELASASESSSTNQGLLQLVPPSQDQGEAVGGSGSDEAAVGAVSSSEVEEVLARTEEELANAQQENAYLNERIRELEEQIAQQGDGTVSDTAMAEMEQSLREKRLNPERTSNEQASGQQEEDKTQPWYRSSGWLIGGGLLILLALVVWIFRKAGGGKETSPGTDPTGGDAGATVKNIRSEAEEILESLEKEDQSASGKVIEIEDYVEPAEEGEGPQEPKMSGETATVIPIDDEEAIELDSEDPEVQLDLARAYLSMGDKEAAREMLESVLEVGNEAQIHEAKDMMKEL